MKVSPSPKRAALTAALSLLSAVALALPAADQPLQSADTWAAARHSAVLTRIGQGNVDLIWVGDSITQYWANNTAIWDAYYGTRNAVNMGCAGDETCNVIWRLDNGEISGISPKLAIVLIGTNNSAWGYTTNETAAGITAILNRLRTNLPQTRILLMGIFPRGALATDTIRARNIAVNAVISTYADNNMIHYMDIGSVFTNPDGSISASIMSDYLHLTAEGYTRWANAIESKVAQLMSASAVEDYYLY
jgi:hypothetical protein